MESTNGVPSAAPEASAEDPSEVLQSAIAVNETFTPLPGEGESTGLESNGDCAGEGETGPSSCGDGDGEEATLERANELFEKGSKAIEDGDVVEAVDSLSRALEIRVANYGELAPECAITYYKYGCALLCKAQVETDPLGDISKNTRKNFSKDTIASNVEDSESSMSSSTLNKNYSSPIINDLEGGSGDQNEEDENEGCEEDEEELGEAEEAEEEDSDLDFAWKMLDIARAIFEKNPEDSLEKVNVFAALGEVSLEREDVETSLVDYCRALAILENLVEPDNRRVIELNFRICLVLEMWAKIEEAISYCEKSISLCKSRTERLQEVSSKSKDSGEAGEKFLPNLDRTSPALPSESSKLAAEIDGLTAIMSDLEKKLEDLQQQLILNPKSILTELLKRKASTSPSAEQKDQSDFCRPSSISSSQMAVVETAGFDSPTISTAANDGVRHLGVVGRGIKRAIVSSADAEPFPKKLLPEFAAERVENRVSDPPSSESSIK